MSAVCLQAVNDSQVATVASYGKRVVMAYTLSTKPELLPLVRRASETKLNAMSTNLQIGMTSNGKQRNWSGSAY